MPNNIIARAPDSNRLDGRDSTSFMSSDQVYWVDEFRNYSPSQTATLTALCNAGDIVVGGWARGVGINFSSEGRYRVLGGFSVGEQGWRTTATATSDAGVHFSIVGAVCYDL